MKERVKALEEKYKDIAQLKEMKEAVVGLKDELVWAMVNEKKNVSMMSRILSFCAVGLFSQGIGVASPW